MNRVTIGIVVLVFLVGLIGIFSLFLLQGQFSQQVTPTPAKEVVSSLATNQTMVKLFFIALDDNGKLGKKIGCNDSAVGVEKVLPKTDGILKATLKDLLSIRTKEYSQAGFYNVFYQSQLTVSDAIIKDGKAVIKLVGTLRLGGVCDNPRVEATLTQTALQFPTVRTVEFFINDVPLKDLLSQK